MTVEAPWQGLLEQAERGSRDARDQLFAALYDELRRLARRELNRGAGPAVAVSATTLVHEVYAGLAERRGLNFEDRPRFMAYVARTMRTLIIDLARERQAQKRGGEFHITHLNTDAADGAPQSPDLGRVSEALDELAQREPGLAQIVDLRYFCGFSFEEIAAMQGVSARTVQRHWEKARLLLFSSLDTGT